MSNTDNSLSDGWRRPCAQEIEAASEATDLDAIIRHAIGDVGSERLHWDGPAYQVQCKIIMPLTMIFHELTTNSVKYGALSSPEGRIRVSWSLDPGPGDRTRLKLIWREGDGPHVRTPKRKGYGSKLMEGTSKHLGGGLELQYRCEGLVATLDIPA